MTSGIYKITCTENQKIYIGSASNIDRRFKTHKGTLKNNTHKNPHLQSAYSKYGEDSFIYEIIEYCPESDLRSREQYWLDFTRCYDREIGFNNCILSDRPLGYKHTEEAKKVMSEKRKGIKQSPETIAKRVASIKGSQHSEETKEKIRQSKLGDKNPMFGVRYTEEQKLEKVTKLLSVPRWNRGKTKENDPTLKKLSESRIGIKPSNCLKCKLIDTITGEEWIAESLKDLSTKTPISLSSINRIRSNNIDSSSYLIKYKLEIINAS